MRRFRIAVKHASPIQSNQKAATAKREFRDRAIVQLGQIASRERASLGSATAAEFSGVSMFVRDFSGLPGAWKIEKIRWGRDQWLALALFGLLVATLFAVYVPDGASVMANATTT
jgi:hypothetical protein